MNRRKLIYGLALIGGSFWIAYLYRRKSHFGRIYKLGILEEKGEMLNELVELIIPKTDVPGAKEAGVGIFVSKLVKNCFSPSEQQAFIAGLVELDVKAADKFGQSFSKCSKSQKYLLLSWMEEREKYLLPRMRKLKGKLFGESFYSMLKRNTVIGFCSSELGATMALVYDYVPGSFENTKLVIGQRAWATR